MDVVENFRKTGILKYNLSENEMEVTDYWYICSSEEIFLRKTKKEVPIISSLRRASMGGAYSSTYDTNTITNFVFKDLDCIQHTTVRTVMCSTPS